jgi:DNA transformation protein
VATSREYLQYVLEQLAGLGSVTAQRMFGGTGLYQHDVFFALINHDTLYLKVDETTRPDYVSRGMEPFRPYRNKPKTSLSYYQVPADILEDAQSLVMWARLAVSAAIATGRARRS